MIKFLNTTLCIIFSCCFSACQPPDDGVVLSDTFLIGDWNRAGFCEDQNILTFLENDTYTFIQSLNEDCANNVTFTTRATGTYDFTGDLIILYQEGIEAIDLGTDNVAPEIILTNEEVYEFEQLNDFTFTAKLISRNGMTLQGPTYIYQK